MVTATAAELPILKTKQASPMAATARIWGQTVSFPGPWTKTRRALITEKISVLASFPSPNRVSLPVPP